MALTSLPFATPVPNPTPVNPFTTLGGDLGNAIGDGTPIYQTLPQALTSLQTKYSDPEFLAILGKAPEQVQKATKQLDLQRVQRGQMPESIENTIKQAIAAKTHQAVTSPTGGDPRKRSANPLSVPTNAAKDIKEMVSGLFHIPGALVNEVKESANFSDKFAKNRAEGMNPVEAFLGLPLIRMIPGTYIARNVVSGNFRDLIQHPVYNTLDVLPYASKLAKGTEAFKLAESESLAAMEAGKRSARPPSPIPTALTKKVIHPESLADPQLVPNALGKFFDNRIKPLGPVRLLSDRMGQDVRTTMRYTSEAQNEFRLIQTGKGHIDPSLTGSELIPTFRELGQLLNPEKLMENFGVTEKRAAELGRIITAEPELIGTLAENEAAYVGAIKEVGELSGQHLAEIGKAGWHLGELYDKRTANMLDRTEMSIHDKMVKVDGGERTLKVGPNKGKLRKETGVMDVWAALADADKKFADPFFLWHKAKQFEAEGGRAGRLKAMPLRAEASKMLNRLQNYPYPRVSYQKHTGFDAVGRPVFKEVTMTDKQVVGLINKVKRAVEGEKAYEKLLKSKPPARFSEVINKKAWERTKVELLDAMAEKGIVMSEAEVDKFFRDGMVSEIRGWDRRIWDKHRRGIAGTWEKMREDGVDPIYVPRVSRAHAESATRWDMTDKIPAIHSTYERVADFTPSVESPHIAFHTQYAQIFKAHLTERALSDIAAEFGTTEFQLRQKFMPLAYEAHELDPRLSVAGHLNDMMSREFAPYNPETMGVFSGSGLVESGNRLWLPRQVARTLEAIHKESPTSMSKLVDPVTGMMRLSLLPLSPRWHTYNIIGGAISLLAEEGIAAFKPSNIRRAREIIKAAKSGGEIGPEVARELVRTLGYGAEEEYRLAIGQVQQAAALRKVFDESWAGRHGKGLVKASYDFNQWFDDLYRTMGYMHRYDKSIAKGLSPKQAQQMGMLTAQKVLQDVMGMTPFERNVLRRVFPFYSWLGHITRYTLRFPFDHPLRASIIGSMAEMVMEDLGSGGNVDMLDRITWGGADKQGNRKGLLVRAMNPFHDVGNLLTLGGWLGSANPIIETLLQQIGVDTSTGGPELFPTLQYDPETGTLAAAAGNPFTNLLYNTIPQSQVAARAIGFDRDFQRLRETNPGTARSMILSGVGIPVLNRATSPEQQYMKAEAARQKDRSARLKDLMKAGDIKGLREMGVSDEAIAQLLAMQKSGRFNPQLLKGK